jgi:hypothetical protein
MIDGDIGKFNTNKILKNKQDAIVRKLPANTREWLPADKCQHNSTAYCSCSMYLLDIIHSVGMFKEIIKLIDEESKLYSTKHSPTDFVKLCRKMCDVITANKQVKKMFYNGHLVEEVDEKGNKRFVFAPDVEACMLYSLSTIMRTSQMLLTQ